MSDIFISYASEDRDRIKPLVDALLKTGWTVFWDRTIPTGKTWRQLIGKEITEARSILVVWSEASRDSDWVHEEAEEGKQRGILFPVVIDDITPPLGFRSIQFTNLVGWDGTPGNVAFDQLLVYMSEALGKMPAEIEAEARQREHELQLKRQAEVEQRQQEQKRQQELDAQKQKEAEKAKQAEAERQRTVLETKQEAEEEKRIAEQEQQRKEEELKRRNAEEAAHKQVHQTRPGRKVDAVTESAGGTPQKAKQADQPGMAAASSEFQKSQVQDQARKRRFRINTGAAIVGIVVIAVAGLLYLYWDDLFGAKVIYRNMGISGELKALGDVPVSILSLNDQTRPVARYIFGKRCASCHGKKGEGKTGVPNMQTNNWLYGSSLEAIRTSIKDGRNGIMPAMKSVLPDDALDDITGYVLSLSGRKVDKVRVAKGKAFFDANCAACHGVDGKGNQAIGAPDLTDDNWLYGGRETEVKESIREGRQGKMPGFGSQLGRGEINLLTVFVHELNKEK